MTNMPQMVRLRKQENGGSLPSVLIAIGVGALLLAPFLAHVSSRMLATRAAEDDSAELYAADSGIEFAIWHLDNDSTYRAAVDSGSDSPLTLTVNGETVSVDSTALPPGEWTELADTLDTVGPGGSLAFGGDGLIYALRGNNSRQAWRYNPATDSWSDFGVSDAPDSVGSGGSLLRKSGDEFYVLRGGGTADFWSYNSSSDAWDSTLSSLSDCNNSSPTAGSGASLVSGSGNQIFALAGDNSTDFCRYQTNPDKWQDRENTPGSVGAGGDFGTGAGNSIYAFRGAGTTDFWELGGNNWSTSPANAPAAVGAGGSLAGDGGTYIYALRGNGTTDFWRYNLSAGIWEQLFPTPESVAGGADLVHDGSTSLYAMQGAQDTGFWKFEITPPRYDIQATAGDSTILARVEFATDGTISVIFWDIQ
ncbi:MAG: hypothetical protein R3191_01445 [Anaerolineales bacterium]|nr:hypothetical protein [Anaerolineales bacterium]